MKRILILALIGVSATSQAQTAATTLANVSKPLDSIVTSSSVDTSDNYTPLKYLNGNDGSFAVHFVATKYSGTATANAILQVTTNGTDWNNLYGTSADTFAVANSSGAQSKQWFITGVKCNRVRVRVLAPSSTQGVQVKTYFVKD